MIGRTLAHYRIIDRLGAGGMGEVFLAQDERLDRRVAIKVFRPDLAADPALIDRFDREAKVLASLNHPGIAAIHGFEAAGDVRFIVMELVEGETLAARLERRALRPEQALSICHKIALALEAAHRKGIVHRDLKPANVMVSDDGRVKILDFGLARVLESDCVGPSATTVALAQVTHPGAVVGTVPYMSPEQACGREVDRRTDVWSFGCVLYECLTRRRAFPGESATEILAAILERTPDWRVLPASLPAPVRRLLYRCLQKDPEQRLRDIGDAGLELADIVSSPETVRTKRMVMPRGALALVLTGTILGAGLLGLFRTGGARPDRMPTVRSLLDLGPGLQLDGMRHVQNLDRPTRTALAIAGDASFVVYSASLPDTVGRYSPTRIYRRRLDRSDAEPIIGTDGGINPFLSPDDRWLGFYSAGWLRKVPVSGGVVTPLCAIPSIYGATWGHGAIVFAADPHGGLLRVSPEGGTPDTLTVPDARAGEYSHRLPNWLPDGRHLLFTMTTAGSPAIAMLDLVTGKRRVLLEDAADARHLASNRIVFLRRGTLMAAAFDPDQQKVIGHPTAMIENVAQSFAVLWHFNTAAGQFAVSRTGWLVYADGGVPPDLARSLVWFDAEGREQIDTAPRKFYFSPRLSPDDRRIAYATFGRDSRLWIYDLEKRTHTPITHGESDIWPIWSPDGAFIAFSRQSSGVAAFRLRPDAGEVERLAESDGISRWVGSFAPDGRTLATVVRSPDTGFDIVMMDVATGLQTPWLGSSFNETCPAFSPDGRILAYVSEEAGRRDVYIQSYPDGSWRRQVSSEGGNEPIWSRGGDRLFYRTEDRVWIVEVATDGSAATGSPRVLFSYADANLGSPLGNWDVSSDGTRFLMVKNEPDVPAPLMRIHLVQNWSAEVENRFSDRR